MRDERRKEGGRESACQRAWGERRQWEGKGESGEYYNTEEEEVRQKREEVEEEIHQVRKETKKRKRETKGRSYEVRWQKEKKRTDWRLKKIMGRWKGIIMNEKTERRRTISLMYELSPLCCHSNRESPTVYQLSPCAAVCLWGESFIKMFTLIYQLDQSREEQCVCACLYVGKMLISLAISDTLSVKKQINQERSVSVSPQMPERRPVNINMYKHTSKQASHPVSGGISSVFTATEQSERISNWGRLLHSYTFWPTLCQIYMKHGAKCQTPWQPLSAWCYPGIRRSAEPSSRWCKG